MRQSGMDQSILRKIKRCLALAKSSNPNEAATALRQAQAMMNQHGLTREDVAVSDVGSHSADAGAGRTPSAHVAMLINLVADAFGVYPVYVPTHDGSRWVSQVEFIGLNGAPEVASYAFEVLGRQLKRDRAAYLKSLDKRLKRTTKVRRGDLYARGWLNAVSRQVVPHVMTKAESQALEAYKTRRWEGQLTTAKALNRGAHVRDAAALFQGLADGRKVRFHQGVGGQRQTALKHGSF